MSHFRQESLHGTGFAITMSPRVQMFHGARLEHP